MEFEVQSDAKRAITKVTGQPRTSSGYLGNGERIFFPCALASALPRGSVARPPAFSENSNAGASRFRGESRGE
jgi:hypothetical protein